MKENDKWLKDVRDMMTDFETELPADGWEKLASALPAGEDAVPSIGNKKKKILPLWISSAAAAIALLIGFAITGLTDEPEYPSTEGSELTEFLTEIPEKNEGEAETAPEVQEDSEKEGTPAARPVRKMKKTAKMNEPLAANETVTKSQEPVETPTENVADETVPVTKQPVAELATEVDNRLLAQNEPITSRRQKRIGSKESGLKMRVGGSGVMNINAATPDLFYDNAGINGADPIFAPTFATGFDSTKTVTMPARIPQRPDMEEAVTDSKNHRAWSAGLSFQKQISGRIALETGLVYTLLTSDITINRASRNNFCYSTETATQRLHYLGIPLSLNISLFDSDDWRIYMNGGTMIERCVAATRNGTSFHDNDWQWSVKGGAGVQYRITRHLGFYVEPGVAYYFDNHSSVPSLYTEHPFNFNLNAGLKVIL